MNGKAILILTALLAGCASVTTEPVPEIHAGFYRAGFEEDGFSPCESGEEWWVVDGQELRARYAETAERDYEPVYAVVRGETGPRGAFGHLGAYDRELRVTEVLEVRAPREGDCG